MSLTYDTLSHRISEAKTENDLRSAELNLNSSHFTSEELFRLSMQWHKKATEIHRAQQG